MNKVQLTSIAIMLQKTLGHSAGDIPLEVVPRLLQEAPLEAVEAACRRLEEARKASEAAYKVYAADPRHGVHHLCSESLRAYDEKVAVEDGIRKEISTMTRPWFEACGSPEWAGIYLPALKYSTPRGAVNWDLTGAKPRVWIERSKPGQAGQGLPGDEVVTYDVLTGRLHWTERAEARHMRELSCLLREVDPEASSEAKTLHAKWSILEIRSAFRRAQLVIPANDPNWSQRWDLLEMGLQAAEKAAASGTYYGTGIVAYFETWEKAQVFLDEVGATALAS